MKLVCVRVCSSDRSRASSICIKLHTNIHANMQFSIEHSKCGIEYSVCSVPTFNDPPPSLREQLCTCLHVRCRVFKHPSHIIPLRPFSVRNYIH